jgi:hypothetical protein
VEEEALAILLLVLQAQKLQGYFRFHRAKALLFMLAPAAAEDMAPAAAEAVDIMVPAAAEAAHMAPAAAEAVLQYL